MSAVVANVKGSDKPGEDYNKNETADGDADFAWDEYLEETEAEAVPHTSFVHVEQSLQSCFTEGMKLEVPNKEYSNTYWVASVVMSCGPLLRLRYEGYEEDRSADFWWDISTSEVHPIGWCVQNKKTLTPPSGISTKYSDWNAFLLKSLTGATTVPAYFLEANGTTPVDLIKQGMKFEVRERLNPFSVWIATVVENVGGRLLLRYDGANPSEDFWMFYLDYRLHPVGWATANKLKYKPPEDMNSVHTPEEWAKVLKQSMEESKKLPILYDIFKNQEHIRAHSFKEGMKLEAVDPSTLTQVFPATVTKVVDEYFFLVETDGSNSGGSLRDRTLCCHAGSPLIFPKGFCKSRGITISSPENFPNVEKEFDWDEYMVRCDAVAAPDNFFVRGENNRVFDVGMKLEVVNPFQSNQICAATVTRVVEHILWIQLDSVGSNIHPNHIIPASSHQLFPVGWCESNRYPLKPPLNTHKVKCQVIKKSPVVPQDKQKKTSKSESDVKAWCPKIYFNHRCFSGPYLSKGRIAELPRDVGPGPVTLVLKEVVSMLINVAYKSSKVLQELQLNGKPNVSMHQCIIKAKYKGKCYRSVVEVLRSSDKVAEFCKEICLKLECCPNLFGPRLVGSDCPEKCGQFTKTKYTSSYSKKKRKVGRPPLTETGVDNNNTENNKEAKVPKKRGRKPKALTEKTDSTIKETANQDSGENNCSDISQQNKRIKTDSEMKDVSIPDQGQSEISKDENSITTGESESDAARQKLKRKYVRYVPPKSDIVTRGAKIPNFALEMGHWRKKKSRKLTENSSLASSENGYTSSQEFRPSSEDTSKEPSEVCPSEVCPSENGFLDLHAASPTSTFNTNESSNQETMDVVEELILNTNPLYWSVDEVIKFIKGTDCAQLARLIRDQDIDGQALLLLTLPTVQEHLDLKLGPAVKLCHQVARVKYAFFRQYANN